MSYSTVEKSNTSRVRIIGGILILGLFLSWTGEQRALHYKGLPRVPQMERINPRILSAQMFGAFFFGGFRGVIGNLTWMYIDSLWHQARFYRLPPLYEFLVTIEPDFINAWVMGGWHMAYNMSLEVPGVKALPPVLRRKKELQWVYRGISFLKSGVKLNPDDSKLAFEVGWTYYHRLKDYEKSIEWFDRSANLPDGSSSAARLVAHAYEKMGDLKKSHEKWLALRSHPSYNHPPIKKIIENHISRLEREGGSK